MGAMPQCKIASRSGPRPATNTGSLRGTRPLPTRPGTSIQFLLQLSPMDMSKLSDSLTLLTNIGVLLGIARILSRPRQLPLKEWDNALLVEQ